MIAVVIDDEGPVRQLRRRVDTLAVLGDSIGVGVGDPVPGGWRGFSPLLADALGARVVNVAKNGARMAAVRREQLPEALDALPDAVVVFAGINDTLRSDFDVAELQADLDAVVTACTAAGALVVTARYHDHGRVFRLPERLRRALRARIRDLNAVVDVVTARHGVRVVDLDLLPGAYTKEVWSVDRLHPSELGHRMLAQAFADRFAEAGAQVPGAVSLECSGSVRVTFVHRWAWLVFKGVPWLWRRGRDLVPYALATMFRDAPATGPEPVGLPLRQPNQ